MGNLYLVKGSVCPVCLLVCFPQKHGSEFPVVDSLSDFADFVSDMPRKGN